jgi:hypothetical protein
MDYLRHDQVIEPRIGGSRDNYLALGGQVLLARLDLTLSTLVKQ